MKFAGSFLSWAQAKTTQTNSLLRRIEDGDGKLALMMLTTLPLYGTVRYLQTQLNPTESFREEFQSPLETKEDLLKFLADTGIFSAQLMPYWADKIFSSIQYNKNNAIENIYPVFGIVNDAAAGGFDVVTGKPRTGAVKIAETVVPGIKEVTRREALLKEEVEDFKAKDTEDEVLPEFSTGGLVSGPEVTDTKENPADRVDPFTGAPYSDQMARLGLAEGKEVKLNRATKNNNPFNIVYGPAIGASNIDWEGKVKHNPEVEDTFEVFENNAFGFRAGILNTLTHYDRDGLNTVEQLITKHAPKKGDIIKNGDENPNQRNFINFVSKNLGVNPNQEKNLKTVKL